MMIVMITIIIELEYKNKRCTMQFLTPCQLPDQPVPKQCPPQPAFLIVYILSKTSRGVGYPFGQLWPVLASCALCVLSQLLILLNPLAGGDVGEAEKALI